MSNAIVSSSRRSLDISTPAPNAMFENRIVSARNLEIEESQQHYTRLDRKTLIATAQRIKSLNDDLTAMNYDQIKVEFEAVKSHFIQTMVDLRLAEDKLPTVTGDEATALNAQLQELKRKANALNRQGQRVQEQLDLLQPMADERSDLQRSLTEHQVAVAYQARDLLEKKDFEKEVVKFAKIIIERWCSLGYQWEYTVKGKRKVDKVAFSEFHVTPDAIFLKIAATKKTLFGFRSVLPHGVRVLDLCSEDTLAELSVATQRQITAEVTQTNGAWIIVNRLDAVDGLMNYVTLEEVLAKYPHQQREKMPIPVGVEQGRWVSWVHIAEHPHFLIGGSTGGGKSNIINVIISTLAQHHSPDEIRLVLFDLKEGMEFKRYANLPHLLMPIVDDDVEHVAEVLARLEALRKERGQQFARVYARSIEEFNARVPVERRLPRILVIFDEYAAIQVRKDMEKTIQTSVMQLLNKGRAVGLHLILCTQNPSVEIIPGPSKANMAFRLAGAMPTKSASMTILGVGDAAELPDIPGRMLAMVGAKIWPVQTPHARERDIEQAIEAAMAWEQPQTIALPEAAGAVGFTEDRLIEMSLEEYGGSLAARKIYEDIKNEGLVSYEQLRQMVKRIAAREQVECGGKVYRPVVTTGGGWRLQLLQPSA